MKQDSNISSYLIQTDVFISHFLTKEDIDPETYTCELYKSNNEHCRELLQTHGVDMYPYYYIVEVQAQALSRQLFYVFFNQLLEGIGNTPINKFEDISTVLDALCYIYMVQYYFL